MSLWIPPNTGLDIAYHADDFILFREKVCDLLGLTTLKKVIPLLAHSPILIKEYIYQISQGQAYSSNGLHLEAVTRGQQKYHQQIFHIMYEIPLEEVPLYVNDDPDVIPVVNWRLEIAK
jgi:hypothetical protein